MLLLTSSLQLHLCVQDLKCSVLSLSLTHISLHFKMKPIQSWILFLQVRKTCRSSVKLDLHSCTQFACWWDCFVTACWNLNNAQAQRILFCCDLLASSQDVCMSVTYLRSLVASLLLQLLILWKLGSLLVIWGGLLTKLLYYFARSVWILLVLCVSVLLQTPDSL